MFLGASVKETIPNKPIRYLINSHVHFDHSGGLRTYVAEGATVVTHQMNRPYYERAWAPPAPNAPPSQVPPSPFAVNLYENIRRLKLDVRQIAALHGPRVATLADLQAAIGQADPNTTR